ncbi:MAG: hypothetical protein WDO18_00095 [Acidobacteriota bacterium]
MPGSKRIRLWWLVVAFLGGVAAAMMAEELVLRTQGSRLEFTTPQLHYLPGRPLARLKNAQPVAFDFHVTLSAGTKTNIVRKTRPAS